MTFLFLFSFSNLLFSLALISNHFSEQFTKEQQDLQSNLEEILDLDTNILDTSTEASRSKQGAPLSLVDDVSEMIVKESVPEDLLADAIKIEEKDSAKAVVGING